MRHVTASAIRTFIFGSVIALVLAGVSCVDFLSPARRPRPQIQELFIDALWSTVADGGLLYVHAVPVDTSFRLHENDRVPAELSVTSGDVEIVELYRLYCPPRERVAFHCFSFTLTMADGHTVGEVAPLIARVGRIEVASPYFASITVFKPNTVVHRAADASQWPGVLAVELEFSGCQSWAPYWCTSRSRLTAPLPVNVGTASPRDGIIQVSTGDTIRVTYRQPDGTTQETRVIAP